LALFYESGRNDLQRAGLSALLAEAHAEGLIGDAERQALERIRKNRNAYAHFRRPGHKVSIEARAVFEDAAPYDVVEQDATSAITAALRLVAKGTV